MHRYAYHTLIAVCGLATTMSHGAAPLPIPDPAYGGNGDGIARIAAAGVPADDAYATHAVALAGGSLVLVGTASTSSTPQTQVVLTRVDPHGLPDTSFGPTHDGYFRTAFPGYADDVAQTGDGKLIYAGHDTDFEAMIVGRLNPDGSPDTGFFLGGRRLIGPSVLVDDATRGMLASVLPLADGKVLAIGFALDPAAPAQYWSCALRLLADGSNDSGFGSGGRTCIAPTASPDAASQALTGAVLADGGLLLAGSSRHTGSSGWDMSVARLDADGVLDADFGPAHDGWAFIAFDQGGTMSDGVFAVAIDEAGRILLAGYLEGVHGPDIGVARLLQDGQPDPSFGSQGRVQIALDLGGANDERAHSIAVLPDGGILVGASMYTTTNTGVAVLLESDGQLDPRFGNIGVFLQADPAGASTTRVASRQQILAGDFLYMVGGAANDSSHVDFAVTRTVMPLFVDGFER